MGAALASLNTKISQEEKDKFVQTAEALGMSPSSAIKVFVRKFNECGGFPFDVRLTQKSESVTYVSDDEFEAFAQALEEPMPNEAKELLERDYEWKE